MESFVLMETFSCKPQKLYQAWLSSFLHSEMIGSESVIDPVVGGSFKIWDNYISGKTIELIPDKKIVQLWRTTEFSDDDKDSLLELDIEEVNGMTKLTLSHSDIPDGQARDYKQGWIEYYFDQMKEYFKQ
jgi:activator of HSP90 ATPase